MSDMEKPAEQKEMAEVKIEDPKAEEENAKAEEAAPVVDAPPKAPKEPWQPPCDLQNRDPNFMNDHVKVTFHDIIAEPDETIFSFDKVFGISYVVFTGTKLWCYRITSLLCAIPLSVVFGVWFACLSFCNIWMWMPCLKGMGIKLLCARRVFTMYLDTCVTPCFESMGKIFSGIRISMRQD